MAIARTRTMLSLDRFANVMGISPVQFNGCGSVQLSSGNQIFPIKNGMESIWPQFDYQATDRVSREQLAVLIRNAEHEISSFLGFYPTPVWVEDEQRIVLKRISA
jgi:hypothetical protein